MQKPNEVKIDQLWSFPDQPVLQIIRFGNCPVRGQLAFFGDHTHAAVKDLLKDGIYHGNMMRPELVNELCWSNQRIAFGKCMNIVIRQFGVFCERYAHLEQLAKTLEDEILKEMQRKLEECATPSIP